jgi:tRNA(Ile)-lysidine synthase
MTVEKEFFNFLDLHHDGKSPLLLALSGGSDSLALFYLLESYKKVKPLCYGIAHVDHGWRSESSHEALLLQKMAEEKKITFHLKTLKPQELTGNLEEASRQARLAFFANLCQEFGYQAVLLGHHADDQSETVLKKVLEGSSLPYLGGMAPCSKFQGINLWRPLLNSPKKLTQQIVECHGGKPFVDSTNFDNKFLRARFRSRILPDLSRDFGKEITASLNRLGLEAQELKAFLDQQLKPYIQSLLKGPFGTCLDLGSQCPTTDFEVRYLIRKACENEGIRLPHPLLEEACKKIRQKTADCQFLAKNTYIQLDRGRLFVMKHPLIEFKGRIPLKLGQWTVGDWSLEVCETTAQEDVLEGWKGVWKGILQIQLPQGNYLLCPGDASLFKWWTNAKVPAFMRKCFPILRSEDGTLHEFLTGRRNSIIIENNDEMHSNVNKKWILTIKHKLYESY